MRLLLAAAGLRSAASAALQGEGAKAQKWNDASFFDSFQTGESTWDYDGAQITRAEDSPYHEYADGWNPDVTNPLDPKEVDPLWFASLPSGGSEQALQTLPEPKTGPYGHDQVVGHWYQNDGGQDIQSYKYPKPYAEQAELLKSTGGDVLHLLKGSGKKQANWFDASVSQYDAYGRPKNPYPGNPAMLVYSGYKQQAANASLSCKAAGCNASVSVSLGQAESDDLQHCKLSVQVKPTDFGPGKVVEFITVNDHTVSLDCTPPPPSQKCGEASDLTNLHTCVNSLDVQHLLSDDGSLNVAAKISEGVNRSDCAYKGNMLYAVPQLTCLVGQPPAVGNVSQLSARPVVQPVNLASRTQNQAALAFPEVGAARKLRVRRKLLQHSA